MRTACVQQMVEARFNLVASGGWVLQELSREKESLSYIRDGDPFQKK